MSSKLQKVEHYPSSFTQIIAKAHAHALHWPVEEVRPTVAVSLCSWNHNWPPFSISLEGGAIPLNANGM